MVAAEGVVALDVAVEILGQRVLVKRGEVIGLAEGVHAELPVERHVVAVSSDVEKLLPVPTLELGCQAA